MAAGVSENMYGNPGNLLRPAIGCSISRNQSLASSCDELSKSEASFTGVTGIRSSCPSLNISSLVCSAHHSPSIRITSSRLSNQDWRSANRSSSINSGRSTSTNTVGSHLNRKNHTQPSLHRMQSGSVRRITTPSCVQDVEVQACAESIASTAETSTC